MYPGSLEMRKKDIITLNDDWYEVQRVLREDPKWDVELLKQYWHCTHTFRKDGLLYFCREIPKIEYQEI